VLCEGITSNLAVTVPAGFDLHWYKNDVEMAETTSSIVVGEPGSYKAQISGKGVTLSAAPVTIIVNTYPAVTIDSSGALSFCPGGSVSLNTNIETQRTYKWFKNGSFFMGSTPAISVSESGKYKVEANSFGCKTFSPEITVTKRNALDPLCYNSIDISEKQLSVSPNPFDRSLFVDASDFDIFPVAIELIDVNGKVVYQTEVSDPSKTEIQPELNNGFYFLKMQAKNKIQYTKIIRQSQN